MDVAPFARHTCRVVLENLVHKRELVQNGKAMSNQDSIRIFLALPVFDN